MEGVVESPGHGQVLKDGGKIPMKRIFTVLAIMFILPALAMAQGAAAAGQKFTFEFVDGANLKVVLPDKTELVYNVGLFEGDSIAPGASIVTGADTSAEFKLSPNGSIVKVGRSSTFKVKALGVANGDKNAFQVAAGKIKAIAAKGSNISIGTPTALCGVRGTDFVVDVEGGKELLAVKRGDVQFDKLDANGNVVGSIHVLGGQEADALAASFAATPLPVEQYDQQFADLAFKKLSESDVPQSSPEPALAPDQGAAAAAAAAPAASDQGAAKPETKETQNGLVAWLQDIMGFEIGSVTIDGTTYAKAVVQPNITVGKLRLGLYLPIIYTNDLFNAGDWYRPAGDNEWSFGSDYNWKNDTKGAALDLARDIALKIKYLEYGKQLEDPFFIKIGNLNDLTIGHGLIMRNYDNSTEFPAIRRIGLNFGFDAGGFGMEALVNDLADPWLYGGRIYFRPLPGSKFAIGLDGAVDTNPASGLALVGQNTYGDPMFVSGGADLDLPIIQGNGIFSLRAFADAAATMPWTRADFTDGSGKVVAAGPQFNLVYDQSTNTPQNWGAATGFIGNVLFLDWRLEYRYYTGLFTPAFYDASYDKMRSSYVIKYGQYMLNPGQYGSAPTMMGIYGEGGFSLVKDRLNLKLGYGWPWSPSANSLEQNLVLSNDEFHAALVVKKGLVPIVNLAGAIRYDRRGLAKAISDGTFQLIDSNTTFSGDIQLPVPKTPNLDLAITFTSVPVRDAAGNIVYANQAAGIPELRPSIGFETRFHF